MSINKPILERSPLISVIIPCYNQGQYIETTLQSVLSSTFKNFEIIIVNDGSTDIQTNELLRTINMDGIEVLHTANQGLSEARNTGIKHSHGKYILLLDSDDKISPGYFADAIEILENNPNIKVVSCEVRFFEKKSGLYNLPDYALEKMLLRNIMVISNFFRREDFDRTNGFNPNMKFGYEDWDFWLSLLGNGGDVYRIPKVHFYYRIKKQSMISGLAKNSENRKKMVNQIYQNQIELYSKYNIDPRRIFEYSHTRRLIEYLKFKIHSPLKYLKF